MTALTLPPEPTVPRLIRSNPTVAAERQFRSSCASTPERRVSSSVMVFSRRRVYSVTAWAMASSRQRLRV
jgi:hypothetical protein